MSVRHSGYDIVEWLQTHPKLTGTPEDIVNSWLKFHGPGFGDNQFTLKQKPVIRPLKSSLKDPGAYFEQARDITLTDKLAEFTPDEQSDITCSYADYQVLIQDGQAYIRSHDGTGKEKWVPLAEYKD